MRCGQLEYLLTVASQGHYHTQLLQLSIPQFAIDGSAGTLSLGHFSGAR